MSEDRWVRIVDPKHVYRAGIDEVWNQVHCPQRWCPVVGLDRQKCNVRSLYKARCRLRDVPPGTKIVDPGEGYELVEPWVTEPVGDEEYWGLSTQSWRRMPCPHDTLTDSGIYRRPIAKPVSKTPQPGEWWFSNDQLRVFIHSISRKGKAIFEMSDGYVASKDYWQGWHHEPACTGWDWQPPQPEAEPETLTLEQRVEAMEQRLKKLEHQVSELEDSQ